MLKNKFVLCFIVALSFLLVKARFLQRLLPQKLVSKLPLGWTDEMYWTVLKSRGKKVYVDIPCHLKQPEDYRPKAAVDKAYQLTEEDIRSFYENGYIGPFTLMPSDEAVALQQHLEERLTQESTVYPYSQGAYVIDAATVEAKEPKVSEQKASASGMPSNSGISYMAMNYRDRHLDESAVLNLFQHPALIERCAQLLGPDLLLWRTQFFPKEPGDKGTPFHQASAYLLDNMKAPVVYPPDRDELFQLTCWIALTPALKENGCMTVVKKTQQAIHPLKISRQFDPQSADDESKRFGTSKIEIDYPIQSEDIMPIEMEAGQFFIFSERAIHGSLNNNSDQKRWAVNGRIIRPDTQLYTPPMLASGHSYKVVGVSQICLDNWHTVLIRGEDRFGHNRTQAHDSSGKGHQSRAISQQPAGAISS